MLLGVEVCFESCFEGVDCWDAAEWLWECIPARYVLLYERVGVVLWVVHVFVVVGVGPVLFSCVCMSGVVRVDVCDFCVLVVVLRPVRVVGVVDEGVDSCAHSLEVEVRDVEYFIFVHYRLGMGTWWAVDEDAHNFLLYADEGLYVLFVM